MKRRWIFLLTALSLVVVSLLLLISYVFYTGAPIIAGDVIHNIEYKPGLRLDIYNPTKRVYAKAPVVLYIHGGAWIGGMKEGLNFNRFNKAVSELRESGYAIVSINYTLAQSDQGPFPACIEDAEDAVIWVYENATLHNLDVNNFGLLGESAGAHIAMMIAYGQPAYYLKEHPQVRFKYVVDVYGPNRLRDIYYAPAMASLYSTLGKLPASMQSRLDFPKYIFGFDPKLDSLRAMQILDTYSPYYYLTASAPPTLLIQGDGDRVVPVAQSITLHAKLDSLGVENEIHIIEGADHAFINSTTEQKLKLQEHIVEFIRLHFSNQ